MQCGAQGTRVLSLQSGYGLYERLVHLVCTDEEHEGDVHYDATYAVEFSRRHMAAAS